jgi:hypothetical protein
MYEIEFAIPVVTSQKLYRRRLADFKKIGLLNIPKDKQIKVVLLATKGTPPRIAKGWPENCDVVIQEYNNVFHVHKLCLYHLQMRTFDSKWYVMVDDDSVTNVQGLIESLSAYDHDSEVYLSTPYEYESPMLTMELKLLHRLGLLDMLDGYWNHDWESHYVSRMGMINIMKNPLNRNYIRKRSKVMDGYSDQFLNYAAKIAGITPIEAHFSSSQSEIDRFSLFGGNLDHIHYVSHDYKNTEVFKLWADNNG